MIRSELVKGDSLGRHMENGEMPVSGYMKPRVAKELRARREVSGDGKATPTFYVTKNQGG